MVDLPVRIEKDEALDLLRRAVQEKGADFKYKPIEEEGETYCAYFDWQGNPSCIVGHVLAYKGVTKADLDAKDFNTGAGVWSIARGYLGAVLAADQSTKAALARAQDVQDNGHAWGEALGAAERVALGIEP